MSEEWTSTNTLLVVSRDDLDPSEVSRRLELEPTIALVPDKSRSFKNGAGLWSIAASEGAGTSTDAQIEALSGFILPIRDQLESLRSDGYCIELLVIGHVTGIHQIKINPRTFRTLQRLDLPVAFTTRRAASDEDLFWADFDAQN
ncbi:DUF4279 domain-containing protein [Nocardia cyriacigeorgica]|uniref:DUF4279 domain-containing protein n=1 Tax=Nocardia cyriacigeorgica TaxID=135487 RepID=UPI0018945AC5|nr:DUF4279 domain-containing protein [Nocardia cyriacigeorgica]MBF6394919.1 DUF4279 domain-containing protein [Nocardia cyriacigeorgica]MBF6400553.1 DUF4279 domain-containing protein [Nocardia cyriacigeorgica]